VGFPPEVPALVFGADGRIEDAGRTGGQEEERVMAKKSRKCACVKRGKHNRCIKRAKCKKARRRSRR
jgi:hypothetical protein